MFSSKTDLSKTKFSKKTLLLGTVFSAVLGLAGCASYIANVPNHDVLLKEHTEQDGNACIRADRIRGWGVLDDDVLSVDAFGSKKFYLVTTMYSCQDILTSATVGFSSGFAEFCGRGRDRIITREDACQVQSIFEFDSREEAFEAFETVDEKRLKIREEQKALHEAENK
jgi:hypothetical protein